MLSEIENMNLPEILKKSKIIPIAVFGDLDSALKTAELLLNNSIYLLEVTLRTEIAFKCIKEIAKKFSELLIGSGSVLSISALDQAIDSGARFGVAPGLDFELVDYAKSKGLTFIPGISTPSELNSALKADLKLIKIFPAANLGGADYIKAITAPFRIKDFFVIPTGGINESNIVGYMKTEKVIACGATYIVDSKVIEKGDYNELNNRMQRTKQLLSF